MSRNINPEILEYIKEIADKMTNNRASVMVGAGFSRNADKIAQTDKHFLDWNELGNVFYKKINGIDNLLFGLDHLADETKLSENAFNYSINQCISLRAAANSLAYIMHQKYSSRSNVYKSLKKWEIISRDMNEFSEVRNKWLDI